MKIVGVIPARHGSTRLPGKPLRLIEGKPLLRWVIEGARQSRLLSDLIVATDHPEIRSLAEGLDVRAVMTASELPSGSDRVWAAIKDIHCDIVINIQGDEPLLCGEWIDRLSEPFLSDPSLPSATLARPWKPGDLESKTTAKVVRNDRGDAIYFSRLPIPYSRDNASEDASYRGCLKHLGMYAYRKDFLGEFCRRGPVDLEKWEGLEQLRVLFMGARMKVIEVEFESWGVDTEEDVGKVARLLKGKDRET